MTLLDLLTRHSFSQLAILIQHGMGGKEKMYPALLNGGIA